MKHLYIMFCFLTFFAEPSPATSSTVVRCVEDTYTEVHCGKDTYEDDVIKTNIRIIHMSEKQASVFLEESGPRIIYKSEQMTNGHLSSTLPVSDINIVEVNSSNEEKTNDSLSSALLGTHSGIVFLSLEQKTNSLSGAILRGDLGEIQALIDHTNVNVMEEGQTPLMWAASEPNAKYTQVVRLLIEKGADINAKTKEGYTALALSIDGGNQATTRLLISKKADITTTNEGGLTPLMFACLSGDLEIVLLLIENGANVNAKSRSGITALMYATRDNRFDIAKMLIERGADVNAKTIAGDTILGTALKDGHKDFVEYLKQHGAREK